MLSSVVALGATAICCAFIGWAVVVLTSTSTRVPEPALRL